MSKMKRRENLNLFLLSRLSCDLPYTFSIHLTSIKITVIISFSLAHISMTEYLCLCVNFKCSNVRACALPFALFFQMQNHVVLPYAKHQSKTQLFWFSSFVRKYFLNINIFFKKEINLQFNFIIFFCFVLFTLLVAVCEFKINGGKTPIDVSLQRYSSLDQGFKTV